jgi:hypothetical protein
MYHATANALSPVAGFGGSNTVHCAHAGPSGGGLLTATNGIAAVRWAWQWIANSSACGVAPYLYVAAQIGNALSAFPTQLATIVPTDPNISSYSIAVAGLAANTDTCRIYHLSTANSGATVHCPHGAVLGGAQCPADVTIPTCLLILTACPTAYSSQAACQAAFGAYYAANKTGDPNAGLTGVPSTDDVGCRVYYATMNLIQLGMGKASVATNCMNAAIAGATGCGVAAMAPTSGAAPVAASAVLSLLMLLW